MLSFMDLPPEIRLIIYAYSLNPNNYLYGYRQIDLLAAAEMDRARGPVCAYPRPYIERYTPTILLLNRQITAEALEVLHKIPIHLYETPPTYFVMRKMDITEFISEHVLQKAHCAILRLDHSQKFHILNLLDIWGQENHLKSLHVYRPKASPQPRAHWKIVKERLRTFSTTVPVIFHRVENPLEIVDSNEVIEPLYGTWARPPPIGPPTTPT